MAIAGDNQAKCQSTFEFSRRYRRAAGALDVSVPVGMVVTLAPWLAAWTAWSCGAAGAACGPALVSPIALRTSASSLTTVSLLSLRNWRGLYRPRPMQSALQLSQEADFRTL